MGNYTKGPVELVFDDGIGRQVLRSPSIGNIAILCEHDIGPPEWEQDEANAALISEAFNVAHETGLTPRQLAGQRERLMACLRAEVADLKSRMFGSTHWQGCEEAHPKCAALKRMQDAIADAEGATP